jgi:hypothetical protein
VDTPWLPPPGNATLGRVPKNVKHPLFWGARQGREEGSKLPAADATEGPATKL